MRTSFSVVIAVILIAICALLTQSVSATPAVKPLPGAVFTTLPDGSAVNENVGYTNKCQVSLNGGPDKPQAHHLPDGVYDVAVTNPSGKVVLGKGEGVVTITNGEGTFGPSSLCDLVEPSPYGTTPNLGDEYKAWLCEEDSLFVNNNCKTDNFKVRLAAPPEVTPTPTLPPTPPPVPEPTPVVTPGPKPVASSVQQPLDEMPSALPITGDAPARENRSVNWLLGLAIAIPLIGGGAWSIHRSRQ